MVLAFADDITFTIVGDLGNSIAKINELTGHSADEYAGTGNAQCARYYFSSKKDTQEFLEHIGWTTFSPDTRVADPKFRFVPNTITGA